MISCILLQRRAAVEQFAGARIAAAAPQLRVIFQQMRREPQRLFAQVGGGGWRRWPERP